MLKKFLKLTTLFSLLVVGMSSLKADSSLDEHYISQSRKQTNSSNSDNQPRNCWKPYFARNSKLQKVKPFYANLNTGVGILYFSDVSGRYQTIDATGLNTIPYAKNLKNGFKCNKSLLNEGILGWNLGGTCNKLNWLSLAISVQNQSGIEVRNLQSYTLGDGTTTYGNFFANMNLTSVALKAYLYFPHSLVMKGVSYSPYLGLGVGPSWQTWTRVVCTSDALPLFLSARVSANCFFGSEVGFKIRSIMPCSQLSGIVGLKFNLWGQSRSIGKADDQKLRNRNGGLLGYALKQPFKVKTVYQWAPFIGFTWAF